MKVIVCIKQVPDINVWIEVDPFTNSIDTEDMVYIVNPSDVVAVEAALAIKEATGNGEVILISLGPERVRKALRKCMAMGAADEAIHLRVSASDHLDVFKTSQALAKAIDSLEYDMILCGDRAKDMELSGGQVGPMIAEMLGLPHVSEIDQMEISPDRKKAVVHRKLERGNREVVECLLPTLFSVAPGLNSPRYPSFSSSLKAIRSEIRKIGLESLGLESGDWGDRSAVTELLKISTPKPRQKRIFTPESHLSASERINLIMAGGIAEKKGDFIEGSPGEMAEQVVEFLVKENIIDKK